MAFSLPAFMPPDFSAPQLANAPAVHFDPVTQAGVAPDGYHATSVYPEYYHLGDGQWQLVVASRMDSVVVWHADNRLEVKEFRHLAVGDRVAIGRRENGEDGIYVYVHGFDLGSEAGEKFVFRSNRTRETSFSIDYDELYDLLNHERNNGNILWVLGPAVVFDLDARQAFCQLIERGYVHGLLAGNALATHDIEGALFGTALGQEIYQKKSVPQGHYKHLDALNRIRGVGSITEAVQQDVITEGVIHAIHAHRVPYVLAGSIRDDGPMPEVVADVYAAQDRMRHLVQQATTVIAMATQLHSIAVGNMTPAYCVGSDEAIRPVYFYTVDMSEFAVNKLADRGSLTARAIITNVQDFIVTLERGLQDIGG